MNYNRSLTIIIFPQRINHAADRRDWEQELCTTEAHVLSEGVLGLRVVKEGFPEEAAPVVSREKQRGVGHRTA